MYTWVFNIKIKKYMNFPLYAPSYITNNLVWILICYHLYRKILALEYITAGTNMYFG